MPAANARRRRAADAALLGLAAMWGATFPLGKYILAHLPPFAYLAARFALATLALLPFARRGAGALPARARRRALAVGAALGAGFVLQTLGLRLAGATVSAFLTAVSVVLVPVFGLFLGQRPERFEWMGVASATAGLMLLTLRGAVHPGPGELLLLGCAVCFAWHILFMDRAAPGMPPLTLGLVQSAVTGLMSGSLLATEPTPAPFPAPVGWAVAGMALLATAAAFSIQAWAQRHTHPTHVGLCLTFEPLAAAFFAYAWLGETLTPWQWVGAALILAGIVMAELKPRRGHGRPRPAPGKVLETPQDGH
jgi:drug/metabolite transporter (DMT)-like permease